ELINALLFSLPGTPIVYYGDEIGMGDNIYLGDRNGVRTPMQWAPDRNGGFSKANPQQLYLPAVIDPEYHYEAVNVETQQRNLSSLFWWMRRLITERKRWKSLRSGTIEFLHPENAKVLVFVRKHEDETFLVLANLARFVQLVELDLSAYAGMVPMEVFSRAKFPEIRSGSTAFTLGPHDFFWIALRRSSASAADPNAVPVLDQPFPWGGALSAEAREILEKELLPPYFQKARWFPGNARQLRDLKIGEDFALRSEPGSARVLLVHASFGEGLPEVYVLPVQLSTGESGARLLVEATHAVLGRFRQGNEEAVLHDAIYDPAFRANLFDIVVGNANARNIRGRRGKGLQSEPFTEALPSQVLAAEQANSTINYGGQYVLKLYRRLEWGKQPEEESLRFLGDSRDFSNVPPYAGAIEYSAKDGATAVLGLLTGFIQNQGDAWAYTVDAVGRYLERVLVGKPELGNEAALLEAIGGVFPDRARQLAQRTAEMHLALTSDAENSPFSREEFSTLYQRSLYQSARGNLRRLGPLLSRVRPNLAPSDQETVDFLVRNEARLLDGFGFLLHDKISASKTIIHGSFHLGQVLNTGKDFMIIDLEGDPAKALSERLLKRSPLRDVASMMRSFDYAANSALSRQQPDDIEAMRPWVQAWTKYVAEQFLEAYLAAVAGTNLVPADRDVLNVLLDFYLVDKAVFEINNELTYRPSMVGVPLRALRALAEKRAETSA
ncbi:MAG: putative maltokinase, partial [Chthoniobacteraceae bacterium]